MISTMRCYIIAVVFAGLFVCNVLSFTPVRHMKITTGNTQLLSSKRLHASSVDEDAEISMADVETISQEIPKYLPSECGVDYIPLATMLATGDFLGADQFTRDNLIKISGAEAAGRTFVYWTEVKGMPMADMATMERLWLQFSDGKFGYSAQKRIWDRTNGNFDEFIRRIGWTKVENGSERKLKWFGANEFIYTLEKAPRAHLPLTSALRGTQLIKMLMQHPVWEEYDWKNWKEIDWEKK